MKMSADDNILASPGDFSTRIDEGVLIAPPALVELAQAQNLGSAEEFAGYARTFPSAVAASLGWQPSAAIAAAQTLSNQLFDAGILNGEAIPSRVYGLG